MALDSVARIGVGRASATVVACVAGVASAVVALDLRAAEKASPELPRAAYWSAFAAYVAYDPDARTRSWREANEAASGTGHAHHAPTDVKPATPPATPAPTDAHVHGTHRP